ncbi:Maf family protein [Luteimonas kalidii]|uniref:dTTP/UTP pyrophosphatase n=1 Tax=Luteimonas kalidii TaxID=3042025 RepID=A0ABT6JYA7_9GAMM|nr:Maf family nucleotide pyrophosphatase [Luteimonas kalidii]MDH5835690.1 Maf family nucleotide pyrophosphatase [Luteimonas kalidii]
MLHLASQSPRRRELLARLGVPFGVIEVDVPEQRATGEPPEDYVRRVAREKAGAGLLAMVAVPGAVVLGADTEVVLDDRVFGKPREATDAAQMLRSLSGRTHEVLSAVSLVSAGREAQALCRSRVTFAELDDAEIAAYVASGEPMGRAGAYAIQGGAERFVARLEGSYSGVMGLPLHETTGLLRQFGIGTGFASVDGARQGTG